MPILAPICSRLTAHIDGLIKARIEDGEVVVETARIAHDGEFVAADAGDEVVASRGFAQVPADDLQHSVAGRMAKGVVDGLEVIEVEHHEHKARTAFGSNRAAALEACIEGPSIAESGQRVGER